MSDCESQPASLDVERLLRLFAFDYTESLWWRGSDENAVDGELQFYVTCNDFFWWGTADCERITQDDLDALEQAFDDAGAVGCREDGPELWVARKRGMKPQGAAYKYIPEAMRPLFDACGPSRESSITNPVGREP